MMRVPHARNLGPGGGIVLHAARATRSEGLLPVLSKVHDSGPTLQPVRDHQDIAFRLTVTSVEIEDALLPGELLCECSEADWS